MTNLLKKVASAAPISVAEFMKYALYSSDGYYANNTPIGREGDFITAPEMTQVFGELIGAWCWHTWNQLEFKTKLNLVELGPGHGTMMRDIIRVTNKLSDIQPSLYLLEQSDRLRQKQKELLPDYVQWLGDLHDLPPEPFIFLANEFFDALPIDQYIYASDNWHLRLVTIENNKYKFIKGPVVTKEFLPNNAKNNDIYEYSESQNKFISIISEHIKKHGSAGLIIDYGYENGSGDSLQALRNNRYQDVLDSPGSADLTTHVNFNWMKSQFESKQLHTSKIVNQSQFLQNLGIEQRTKALCQQATNAQSAELMTAAARLISPQHMGELFKVLMFSSNRLNFLGEI